MPLRSGVIKTGKHLLQLVFERRQCSLMLLAARVYIGIFGASAPNEGVDLSPGCRGAVWIVAHAPTMIDAVLSAVVKAVIGTGVYRHLHVWFTCRR
jgi:hypothetical protein